MRKKREGNIRFQTPKIKIILNSYLVVYLLRK
jgi:hypothetical protein